MSNDLILVTDWEKVDKDDFYLTDEWQKSQDIDDDDMDMARNLQKEGRLYEAYIVRALDYALYWQMDADKVFINEDMDVLINCESAIIGNNHERRIAYEI